MKTLVLDPGRTVFTGHGPGQQKVRARKSEPESQDTHVVNPENQLGVLTSLSNSKTYKLMGVLIYLVYVV